MPRIAIPKKLKLKLMYDSGYMCAICQKRGAHIHHIDENNSNNNEDNLVVLCNEHHDEAHTKHQLSQNLNADSLKHAKNLWLASVAINRSSAATVAGQLSLTENNPLAAMGVTWGYINHRRVGQLAKPELLGVNESRYFGYCKTRGIIDEKGILIAPHSTQPSSNYIGNTIYDWYEFGDDQRIHAIYCAFVDQISEAYQPIHLDGKTWSKESIQALVSPGSFVFLNHAFYFSCVNETTFNQHRRAYTRGKIKIEFYVDTMDMFGTTSITVSFSGYKNCAALLHLKSVEEAAKDQIILHCSPIALGVAFGRNWGTFPNL